MIRFWSMFLVVSGHGFGGDDYETLNYGFIVGNDEVPVAFTGGVRIGWVF